MGRTLRFFILITLFFSIISGCGPKSEEIEITVAAASDLSLAFTEVGEIFEQETGIKITFSFGSTGQLADQIEHGAPFDVFAAANISFVDNLREKGLVNPETQMTYAFGRIGLTTLLDSPLNIETLEDLAKPEVIKIAIANPDHAPYGLAAKQALETLGLWEQIEEKLVYGKNISETLTFIETGNVEAGIVALSLYNKEKVNFHLIDEDLHAPLEQSIAVINRTNQEQAALDFINFILGPIGKPIMESYGFIVPTQ
ncbi:molybdate ABC transporter substrate-binding protein [Anaerobacillus sp. CMMVII]|uniref:molybdate ABC transporter substrate-binding protein n=1 Tax=Anaerobacillus sp. CMMVII TaxID=2755588 RepID=UPI0021B82AAA|nr:molybdate ABC transporter substrate-binding protein [Anaerobacillus sp. CMMVII]MCT8139279.1 molybdate ABC transporter substrate-binding protein [Anaerobacillus sp. CMMVII]